MKEIIALQEYTDKFVSLYKGEIRYIEDGLANELIEKEIVAQNSSDGSQGGGGESSSSSPFFVIKTTDYDSDEGQWSKINCTFEEISDAFYNKHLIPIFFKIEGESRLEEVYYFCQFMRNARVSFKSLNNHQITIMSDDQITQS